MLDSEFRDSCPVFFRFTLSPFQFSRPGPGSVGSGKMKDER